MPELPEVETLARQLRTALIGRTITRCRLRRRDIVRGPARPRNLLVARRIAGVIRRGKQLAITTEGNGPVLTIQLGMTGQAIVLPPRARPDRMDHIHAEWSLALDDATPAGRLLFRDPRRFGAIATHESHTALLTGPWARLGPDALGISAPSLRPILAASRRPVKARLLDQCAIAGIGNIYADEALFLARLHPLTPCDAIRPPQVRALARAIRAVLNAAIESGGSTLRDYRHADGRSGAFQTRHRVYARAGLPCLCCATTLLSEQIAQRTTVWCPRCQSLPATSAAA